MSAESPLDPQLIEQTKKQIRALVTEIAQLSKEDVAPEEFYGQFLTRIVSALAAPCGAVWTRNEEGRLALQYHVNLQESNLRERPEEEQVQHGRLLQQVFRSGEGLLVPPHTGAGEVGDEPAGNPTPWLLVLGPLKTDLETVGVVEVFQRAETGPNTQRGYLRFLMQMCELATDFLKSHQLRHFSDRQVLWTQLEDFTQQVHTGLDPRETAYTIANEGRRLIDCDRVSVAIRHGNKCRIEAVSGQELFDKRSNTVRLLGKLATAVVRTGDAVWYTGDTRDMAPQVEEAIEEYVDESHSKTVAVLPLKRPDAAAEEEPEKPREPEPPVGALIVEQIEDSRVPPSLVQRVEVVCRHSSAALGNAMEHQNLFLMPVWRTLGKTRWVVQGRTLPKTLTVVGVVLALLAAAVFWPADFELESDGTLEPAVRRDVFAESNGVVKALGVQHGQRVERDQLLAVLQNYELEVALEDVVGNRLRTLAEIAAIDQDLPRKDLTEEERNRLYGQKAAKEEDLSSYEAQLLLYKKKEKQLQIRSPLAGQVVTWDLKNRLINRPVQVGQVMMRVADLGGPWQLELSMPEKRMGHIVRAQQEIQKDLPVTFILATDPGREFQGTVKEVHLSAEVHGDEGNTVLIKVAIEKEELPQLRPGATVNAKVYCGRRSIGYVWLHDLFAFVRSRILFRWF